MWMTFITNILNFHVRIHNFLTFRRPFLALSPMVYNE